MLEWAFQLSDAIRLEAAMVTDKKAKEILWDHAFKSESVTAARAAREYAWIRRELMRTPADFDNEPWLLNCVNGTVDLWTGELSPPCRGHMLTKMCPTSYIADAPCPAWLGFLDSVFGGDVEMIGYIRRLLGYCLTGDTSVHMLPVFYGEGGNGKGTLIKTFLTVLGKELSCTPNPTLLLAKKNEQHPTAIVSLSGKRAAICQETGTHARIDEAMIKSLTGGDLIEARRMYEDNWQFTPTHKLILATNYKPHVSGQDLGIWRRLRLVPFEREFTGEKEDPELPARLLAEVEGVLAWAVRGSVEWHQGGERMPEAVAIATAEYRRDEDIVGRFIEARCERVEGAKTPAGSLYAAFADWCEKSREKNKHTHTSFGLELTRLKFQPDTATINKATVRCRVGLRLIPTSADDFFDPNSL